MTRTQEKSRQQIAADKMTPVGRIVRALQSGQLKSELRTLPEAIHMARAFSHQAKIAMEGAEGPKLNPENGLVVQFAYLTPDLSTLYTRKFVQGEEATLQETLSKEGTCCIPVGLVFGIYDPQKKAWLLGARPFLNTPLVIMALNQRVQEEVNEMN